MKPPTKKARERALTIALFNAKLSVRRLAEKARGTLIGQKAALWNRNDAIEDVRTLRAMLAELAPQAADVEIPQSLDTPAFRAAWKSYLDYRRDARLKALKASSIKRQLSELAAWGEGDAVRAIGNTIRNGWHGLFKPVATDQKTRSQPTYGNGF